MKDASLFVLDLLALRRALRLAGQGDGAAYGGGVNGADAIRAPSRAPSRMRNAGRATSVAVAASRAATVRAAYLTFGVPYECACGFTCGSLAAWELHQPLCSHGNSGVNYGVARLVCNHHPSQHPQHAQVPASDAVSKGSERRADCMHARLVASDAASKALITALSPHSGAFRCSQVQAGASKASDAADKELRLSRMNHSHSHSHSYVELRLSRDGSKAAAAAAVARMANDEGDCGGWAAGGAWSAPQKACWDEAEGASKPGAQTCASAQDVRSDTYSDRHMDQLHRAHTAAKAVAEADAAQASLTGKPPARVCVAGLDDGVDSLGGSSLACSSVRMGATLSHRSGHRSSYPRMQALGTAPRRSGHRSSHPRQVERQGERAAERTSSTRGFHQHTRSPGQHTRSPGASHHHHHHHRCRRQQQEQQQLEEEHTHPNLHPPPLPSPPQQQHRHARDPHERHTDRLQRRYQAQDFEHHAHRGRRGPESAGPQKHKQLRTKAVCIHHESDGVSV